MIADASVLIVLSRAGELGSLRQVAGNLVVPEAVHREAVAAAPEEPDAKRIRGAIEDGWIAVEDAPEDAVEAVHQRHPDLGAGEAAVLALATEEGADVVLLDDRLAREAAKLEELRPVGTLGVLARAYREGHLADRAALQSAVRDVLEAGLWVSADVVEAFWDRVGGRP